MARTIDILVGATSTITRLSAYTFLRWIPGHHFPPIIVATLVLYLTLVVSNSSSFGSGRPSLREAFPKLFKNEARQETNVQERLDTAHDEPILYEEETRLLKVLGLGIPNWHEWELSYLTISLNVLVALLSLDLVFRGPMFHSGKDLRFSRLGFVDDTTASVLIREPDSAALPIYVYLRASSDLTWSTADTIYHIGEETDFTRAIHFETLKPDTAYTYSLSNELGGTFKTAPAKGSPQARSLTFLTSSCIKANFPYDPFSHSLAIHGFKYVSQILRSLPNPAAFMMFLGDFIYVDVPFRLSSSQEHYRSEYRRVYASPSWKTRGLDLPWLHTLDDHEIANDWAGGNDTQPFPAASDPFINYHVAVNPPIPMNVPAGLSHNATFFQFTQGPASFFMLDTRRYRTRPENPHSGTSSAKPLHASSTSTSQDPSDVPTMLGAMQLQALLTFLQKPETTDVHWKIVATSVPFTKNWRFGTSDTWGGFLSERAKILEAMHFAEAHLGVRVIILSGDRHEFAAIRFPPKDVFDADANALTYDTTGRGPHEFSVGPLSMFYLPFRTFKQVDAEDLDLAYYPDGNSKVGSIEISAGGTTGKPSKSTLKYTLWIDGKAVWDYTLASPSSVKARRSHIDTWYP